MSLVVGENSWVTVAEADTYFSLKPGTSDWFSLPETGTDGEASKEAWLVTAYYWLIDDAFGLAPTTLANDYIKRAQCEAALFLLRYSDEYEQRQALIASGVDDFKQSKWEETLSTIDKPQNILNILGAGGQSGGNRFVDLSNGECC